MSKVFLLAFVAIVVILGGYFVLQNQKKDISLDNSPQPTPTPIASSTPESLPEIVKTIPAMFRKYEMKEIMPDIGSYREFKESYYNYPGYREKIKKFGLMALELK